jgi:hypothetical protein
VLRRNLDVSERKQKKIGENCAMRIFMDLLIKLYHVYQIKEDEMMVDCSTYGRDEKRIQSLSENLII